VSVYDLDCLPITKFLLSFTSYSSFALSIWFLHFTLDAAQRRSNVVLVLKWSFLSCAVSRPSLHRIPMCSSLLTTDEHFSPDTLGYWRRRAFLAAADTGDCRSQYILSTGSIKHLQYSSMIRSFQSRWTFCLMYSWLPTHHALSCWQNI
jgi:hypothetical protein